MTESFQSVSDSIITGTDTTRDIEEGIISENISNSHTSEISTPNDAGDWSDSIEILVKRWKVQIDKLSDIHDRSGFINRARYYRLAIPSILLPFIMTLVSQNLYDGPNDIEHIITGVAFLLTSAISALSLFFNYNQISEKHFQIGIRYTDLSNRIDAELAKRRKFRESADLFIVELKDRIESLGDAAPHLPGQWC